MSYNFDEIVNRYGTSSIKWDLNAPKNQAGATRPIPMMIADMDLKCPPAIIEAMRRVAERGVYGYTSHFAEPRYLAALCDWYGRRYGTVIEEDWVLYSTGSVTGINCAVNAFSSPGDGVIIMSPVYGHFRDMIENETYRRVVDSHLINTDGYYTVNWADFEEKCAQPTNRVFILCSPANPVGRVWSEEELRRMADICKRNHVTLISDEIHSDIVRSGVTHTTILKAAADHSNIIMINGVNKSFNVAGLHCANVIIPDENLRGIFKSRFGEHLPSPFSVAALIAAYDESEDWLDALNKYLDDNIDFAMDFIKERMPGVKIRRPEGTYVLWLDFSGYGLSGEEIHRRIYDNARVLLQDGLVHDLRGGECFQRICIPVPRALLEEALTRIAAQLEPIPAACAIKV
ncbi:MAG: pyridoxal phosphate-dependent aminotransferase [Oscillospiraceae bacterium]|nr:pyridoxal phosphate-dependent aminotransferase [Oscillospiraceae bacterium]